MQNTVAVTDDILNEAISAGRKMTISELEYRIKGFDLDDIDKSNILRIIDDMTPCTSLYFDYDDFMTKAKMYSEAALYFRNNADDIKMRNALLFTHQEFEMAIACVKAAYLRYILNLK